MSIIDDISASILAELNEDTLVLPRLPELVGIIGTSLGDDSTASIEDIAHAISHDAIMSAMVLRAANSTKYTKNHKTGILTVYDAVNCIGIGKVRGMVVADATRKCFSSDDVMGSRVLREYWKHSVEVGSIAAVLCGKHRHLDPETAMISGVLHDIGVIPVIEYLAMNRGNIILGNDVAKYEIIRMVVEATHVEIGKQIAINWLLPSEISDAISTHHQLDAGCLTGDVQYKDLITLCDAFDEHNEGQTSKEKFNTISVVQKLGMCSDSLTIHIRSQYDESSDIGVTCH